MNMTTIAETLPIVNATLNATSAVLLFTAWRAIRAKNQERHRRLMNAAFVTSSIFLACYLTRFALTGSHRFPLGGPLRVVYLTILVTHMILATATVPLVFRSFFLARRGRFAEHRKLVRWTFPIWMYVSVTGVVVYVMLYRLPGWVG